ncbi:beta-lactamase family protein [Hypomontagnella monticulosa]|nr:beta-lactamase family protein [Hypomontagnella monticulosa]
MDYFRSDAFSSLVRELMDEHHTPGFSIAVVQDEEVDSAGYGYAHLESKTPVTPDTLFDIASCSKSMTATAVGLLVEDDEKYPEVQYTATMSSLLPDDFVLSSAEYTNSVTLDDILSHRTGMPTHDKCYMGPQAAQPDDAKSITRNLRHLPMAHPLRTKYIYNNMMFTVATYLVEVKSQKSFSDFLQERIFKPLGMDSTTLQPSAARARFGDRVATGYEWDKETSKYSGFPAPDSPEAQGAGSVVTSAKDFIKWVGALLRREGPISEKVYRDLVRIRSIQNPGAFRLKRFTSPEFYGTGLDIYYYRGYTVIAHDGGISGFGSRFFFMPELGFGAAMVGNSGQTLQSVGGAGTIANILSRRLIDAALKVSEIVSLPRWKPKRREEKIRGDIAIRQKNQPNGQVQDNKEQEGKKENESEVGSDSDSDPDEDEKEEDKKESPSPQVTPLTSYVGSYWNPGYRRLTVQIKNDKLFIDATDRTTGFRSVFEHISDQTKYILHSYDMFEGGDEPCPAEFVFENGRAVKLGVLFEEVLKEMIWFELEREEGEK